jgi:hypothetical protein
MWGKFMSAKKSIKQNQIDEKFSSDPALNNRNNVATSQFWGNHISKNGK